MTRMCRISTLIITLFAVLICGSVQAQASGVKVKTAGDISYITGGVGRQEQVFFDEQKPDYNLRFLFAVTGSGSFLSGIPVTIADSSGRILLETVSDGPYLYAKVPPGTYRLSAERAGLVQTRTVRVPARGGVAADFRWAHE